MKGLPALYLSLVVALLVGCGTQPGEGFASSEGGTSGRGAETSAARVVCDGGGLHVLTPEVAARPDGLHLAVDNRLTGRADLSVSHPDGGLGWSLPPGESRRVANVPPGEVEIDCYRRSWGKVRLFAAQTGTVRVLANSSGYKSTKLECPEGRSKKIEPFTKEETEEQEGDPVEAFRRSNAGSIREGDVVEAAGNTRSQDGRTVRLVRDGRVTATAHYLRFSKGWLEATDESCAGF